MLSSALTRCRDRDVDLNAVVLTATGREKNTAALVSPSLIAIHVNAKTVSLFLAPVFSHRFLPIIGGSISGWRFPVSMSYAEPFSFFLTCSAVVFRVITREYLVNHPLLLLLLC